jgi:hypothetical protein
MVSEKKEDHIPLTKVPIVTFSSLEALNHEGDIHNKALFESQWNEYQACLGSEERQIAIEAFETHTKELNNVDEAGKTGSERTTLS